LTDISRIRENSNDSRKEKPKIEKNQKQVTGKEKQATGKEKNIKRHGCT